MKRALLLFGGLALAGCGSDESPDTDADQSDATTEDVTADGGFDAGEIAQDVGDAGADADADEVDVETDADLEDTDADTDDVADVPVNDTSDATDTDVEADADADTDDTSTDPDVEPDPDIESDPEIDEPDTPTAWFELGIGEESFAPVVEGQDAFMAQGIQGGFHIWGAFQGAGFEAEGYSLEATLRDSEGGLVGAVFYDRALETNEAGDYEAVGVTVFIAPTVIPELEDGSVWEYCGTLTSTDGFVAEQCASITARCCEYLDF